VGGDGQVHDSTGYAGSMMVIGEVDKNYWLESVPLATSIVANRYGT